MARTRKYVRKTKTRTRTRKRKTANKRQHKGGRKTVKGGLNVHTLWHGHQARKHARRSRELAGHMGNLAGALAGSLKDTASSTGKAFSSLL